jgi:hypothetical protein
MHKRAYKRNTSESNFLKKKMSTIERVKGGKENTKNNYCAS